jgi:alcohol dehydrogenase class IV
MFALKSFVHRLAIAISRLVQPMLPDKVPVTFVGSDAVSQLCQGIAQTGHKKVLVVTDAVLVKLGIVEKITGRLGEAGIEWCVYDGVLPDPTFDQIDEGLARLRSEKCDAVLAIGGGSAMDASKVIATLVTNDKPVLKLEGLFKVSNPMLPLFVVPTTAGTGSEATIVAVVSDTEAHTKRFFIDHKLLPSMVALDASLMTGLPQPMTAATGMDALTHAIESYISVAATDDTKRYSVAAVRMIFANLPTAYATGNDMSARSAMALASYYAGVAFTRSGVGYVHAVAHQFGAYYGTPHGLANAIVLPHILEFSKGPAEQRLAELADVIGIEGTGTADKAARFIGAVRELSETVEIPVTLAALTNPDIAPIAKRALAEAHTSYPVPRYMSQDQCETLLNRMLAA